MTANDKHTPTETQDASNRKVTPDELSEGFRQLGLAEGDAVMLHASLETIGNVDGGAAMVLHRLIRAIGKEGTILTPTFTSVTRHSSTHDNYTKLGCWCEGHENRHLPYISELQPDKEIGAIAHRLCSWPSSRRSTHPAYSFVVCGGSRR
jgi:aminoglycoside 3-N-acetyltransferase